MSAKFWALSASRIVDIATREYSNNPSNMSWFTVKGYAEALLALEED